MPRALHVVPPPPSLHTALERFLARSRFAARTRKSYAQDLAPLLARVGEQPVTSLTHQTTAMFLATQEHLAASTFNRRYAALRSFVRWCQQQGWLEDEPLDGLERRPQPRNGPRALDPEQVEQAATRLDRDRYHATELIYIAEVSPLSMGGHHHQQSGFRERADPLLM